MSEIENLKEKLQIKNQVIGGYNSGNQDAFPRSSQMRNTAYQSGAGECGMMFCGMGSTARQTEARPSTLLKSSNSSSNPDLLNNNRGTIFNFLNRETVKRQLNETEDNNDVLPEWLKNS